MIVGVAILSICSHSRFFHHSIQKFDAEINSILYTNCVQTIPKTTNVRVQIFTLPGSKKWMPFGIATCYATGIQLHLHTYLLTLLPLKHLLERNREPTNRLGHVRSLMAVNVSENTPPTITYI